jgi:hypothetical protein
MDDEGDREEKQEGKEGSVLAIAGTRDGRRCTGQ